MGLWKEGTYSVSWFCDALNTKFQWHILKITDDKVTSGPLSPLGWGLAMTNGQGRQLGGGCLPYSFYPEELFTWL